MHIAILGEALIDFKSRGDMNFRGFIGGAHLNVATAAARLGQQAAFLGHISSDAFGTRLLEHLSANHVDTSFVQVSDAPTALAFIQETDGNVHFTFVGNGAATTRYDPQPRPVLPETVRFIQFGSISLLENPTAKSITDIVSMHRDSPKHPVTIVFDPNCRPALTPDRLTYRAAMREWLALADLVKVSDQDLSWLEPNRPTEDVAREWLTLGPQVVIVTRGQHGSTLYRSGKPPLTVEAPNITVCDTVGAGDTFTAALMVKLLDLGHEIPAQLVMHHDDVLLEAMRFAAQAAAINCTREGCDPPTRAEVLSA
jgi:fructokinase